MKHVATVKVTFNNPKGVSRKLYQDEYGYFIKHQGLFAPVSIGAFDKIENGLETCSWFVDYINPFVNAYRAGEITKDVVERHLAGEEGFTGSLHQALVKLQEEQTEDAQEEVAVSVEAPKGKKCGRCSGTGNIAHYRHVEGGMCFSCHGTGDTILGKELKDRLARAGTKQRTPEEQVHDLKQGIGSLYDQITNPPTKIGKLPAIQKERRRVLVSYVNELSREHGIVIRTVEQFEELAKYAKEREDDWF